MRIFSREGWQDDRNIGFGDVADDWESSGGKYGTDVLGLSL